MQKIGLLGGLLLLSACAATQPNPAPLPPSGPITAVDRFAFTKIDQKTCPTEAKSYADWVERYEAFAYKNGQPKELIADAFEKVKENPDITVKQAKQPEFVTPVWTYLSKAVSDDRVARGLQQYMLNRAVVDATARQYGVDSGTLMGSWASRPISAATSATSTCSRR